MLPTRRSILSKRDYLERVCRGGFPEVIGRRADRRRAWFRSYVQAVIAREMRQDRCLADGCPVDKLRTR